MKIIILGCTGMLGHVLFKYLHNNSSNKVIGVARKKNFNTANKKLIGVKVITQKDYRWHRKDIKTNNLLPNILAEQEAYKRNAYTAILIKNNKVTEGCHSNIWAIKNKKIYTHPSNTDILKGVTRTRLKFIIKNCLCRKTVMRFLVRHLHHPLILWQEILFLPNQPQCQSSLHLSYLY